MIIRFFVVPLSSVKTTANLVLVSPDMPLKNLTFGFKPGAAGIIIENDTLQLERITVSPEYMTAIGFPCASATE